MNNRNLKRSPTSHQMSVPASSLSWMHGAASASRAGAAPEISSRVAPRSSPERLGPVAVRGVFDLITDILCSGTSMSEWAEDRRLQAQSLASRGVGLAEGRASCWRARLAALAANLRSTAIRGRKPPCVRPRAPVCVRAWRACMGERTCLNMLRLP